VETLKEEQILYILDVQLPEMLKRRPELEPRVFRAFMKAFATKEEVAAILAELREFRGEFYHFQKESESRFDEMRDFREEFHYFREETGAHLKSVDQRFEQVDGRLESIDQRFEQVDGRLESIDQRFEQVDGRLESVDQRFEQVDRRFDELGQKMDDLKDWVHLVVGRFQVRAGRKLEDVVAGTLRLALKRPDINPDKIRLRQKLVDEQGVTGLRGRRFEVDILTDDGQITVFEVKSVCEAEDVDRLADKITLVRALNPGKNVDGVMIALGAEEEAEERCAEYGIPLIY